MAASALDGFYYAFSIPLGLFNLVLDVMEHNKNDPNVPQVPTPTANRQWFSQPRPAILNDPHPVTEVLTVNFKLPLSISELGWEALRVGMHMEAWYQDRQNNWRQVLDEVRVPVTLDLSASQAQAWYKAHYYCYPIVAKALQFRFTRKYDPVVGTQPYCVGMRNGLIRRNIYTRPDGTMGIEPQQDPIGNVFTSYIKDWDASKAFDNHPTTFWRSMPMPDPAAVCSLYLDCRNVAGNPQLIDTLYLDPVYINQTLNLYYSNDDTQGTLKLSPVAAVPTTDENTTWTQGQGRRDSSSSPGVSLYQFPMTWGPLISQDTWIGIEWVPDFDPTAGPPQNPVLLNVTPPAGATGLYWPKIYYDVGGAQIVLELTNGTATQFYSCPLSPLFARYTPLRIVVGWSYEGTKTVFISVKTPNGTTLGTLTQTNIALPTSITLDGSISFSNFRGLFTAHVIKLEAYSPTSSFQANPQVYVSPDPVQADPNGNLPATTLDNAIYAAAWASQEHGTGGDHESRYSAKTWTPIWRNYLSQKGKLFFPQQTRLKYLKCEFTNLTEEAYPIFDSGITTSYRVFPVSVTQTVTRRHHPGLLDIFAGLLTLGADVVLSGIGSVNFLNPSTVNNAVNAIYGQTVSPVSVQSGPGTTVTSLPNSASLNVASQTRQEVSSPWVYRRSPSNASALASSQINGAASSTTTQTVSNPTSQISGDIAGSFSPLAQFASSPTSLPTQGNDFWVFPGATLRMPAAMMNGLTGNTETVCGRKPTTETRLRFDTTSVHRYDVKTATRDAAVAYFAGVREIQPYVSTYITGQDPPNFTFSSYDSSQWVLTNTEALDSGPITTAGVQYSVINPGFDQDLTNWTQAQGAWVWDGAVAHWYPGTARVSADGTEKILTSSEVDVAPGAHIDASVWVTWSGFAATAGSQALQLQALYYLNGTYVSNQVVGLTRNPWPAATPPDVNSNVWAQIVASQATGNQFTVPAGVNQLRLALVVSTAASAGTVWFDTVDIGTTDSEEGTAFKDFITTSTFAKLKCTFTDSGVVRSDDMWAREDPNDTNISNTALAYYTDTIPDQIPAGMWGDTFATWGDPVIKWGEPRAVVAIQVDPDRIFDGKRVLHFTRAGGAEEAGIKVRQLTNFVANGLFRIGCVFFKPTANTNQVTIRLRRVSDGVYVYQETFNPVVGYWYEHVTNFIEIPNSEDQVYTVELVCTGDQPDEFYLNDLYTEVAPIRYFCRLGDSSQFLHDITQLRYADSAVVSCTTPVNEFSVEVAIMSPRAYAYGCSIQPVYLK